MGRNIMRKYSILGPAYALQLVTALAATEGPYSVPARLQGAVENLSAAMPTDDDEDLDLTDNLTAEIQKVRPCLASLR